VYLVKVGMVSSFMQFGDVGAFGVWDGVLRRMGWVCQDRGTRNRGIHNRVSRESAERCSEK
jgi:hypothetical protein